MNRPLLPCLFSLLAGVPALAQGAPDHLALGKMWTFENPPLAYLEQEYGFQPDQKWLDSLRLAALRLGERENPWCSASFVSPRGLIMTNHHCVREQIASEQGTNDWVRNGFAATELADEVKIPALTVQQLVAQEDVTARVLAGVGDDDDATAAAAKREQNIEAIKTAADEAHPGFMHEVVPLYQGVVFQLYRYRVFDDLRLVVAPHLQTAHFGGDPDNFTYPRWSIDFSFVRAYVNDQPADTSAHYFRWRKQGAVENELVFVPGNPGQTNRQMTISQLEVQRDVEYPLLVQMLRNGLAILRPFKDANPGILTTVLSWENGYKSIGGMLRGLQDESLMQQKRVHEDHLRATVAEDQQLGARFGDVWRQIDAVAVQLRELLPQETFYSASYSSVLERGLAIAKALDETLSDEERSTAKQAALAMRMGGNRVTRALLQDHFERAAEWLDRQDPFLHAVAGEMFTGSKTDWAEALLLLRRSELRRGRFVRQLLDADDANQQWNASIDQGVVAARTLYRLQRDVQARRQVIDGQLERQTARVGQALHAVYGNNISPDATMTLRFSDGRVGGYAYNGTLAPWATTFYGLYGRNIEFGNDYPFNLPPAWLDAVDTVDRSKRVCFASTNDIVGGNSGSCVVDRELQVVGLIFDGNIESLPNDFYYTQTIARAVSVHTDAIVEALQHVYGMQRIVDELQAAAAK